MTRYKNLYLGRVGTFIPLWLLYNDTMHIAFAYIQVQQRFTPI